MEPDPAVEGEEPPGNIAGPARDDIGGDVQRTSPHVGPDTPHGPQPTPPPSTTSPGISGTCPALPDTVPPAAIPQGSESQQRANRQRKHKRKAKIAKHGYEASLYALKRHVRPAVPIIADLKYASLPATSCGYAALNYRTPQDMLPAEICSLVEGGYEYIPNDGMQVYTIYTASFVC